jgi:hypothetical protein
MFYLRRNKAITSLSFHTKAYEHLFADKKFGQADSHS